LKASVLSLVIQFGPFFAIIHPFHVTEWILFRPHCGSSSNANRTLSRSGSNLSRSKSLHWL